MDVSYDLIKIFIKVAKYGNISEAAGHLNLTQSAVSQSIKRLENTLNTTLFFRTKKGVVLTPEGDILFKEALYGEQSFNLGITKLLNYNQDNKIPFKIKLRKVYAKLYIYPVLDLLLEKYPNLTFEFVQQFDDYHSADELCEGRIDLSIIKDSVVLQNENITARKIDTLKYAMSYNPNLISVTKENYKEILKTTPIVLKNREIQENAINDFIEKYSVSKIIKMPHDDMIADLLKKNKFVGITSLILDDEHILKTIDEVEIPPINKQHNIILITNKDNVTACEIANIIIDKIHKKK